MNILFFAARKLQYTYFSKVAQQLQSQSPQHLSHVAWHKTLWINLTWLKYLFIPSQLQLSTVVENHIKEKQNSRKGLLRSPNYWPKFKQLKLLESRVLFAIYYATLIKHETSHMVIWNGLKYRQCIAIEAATSLKVPCIYMENGLLPGMTTIDAKGINFRNSVPRQSEFYSDKKTLSFEPNLIQKIAKPLRQQFSDKPSTLPPKYIFVPFQVNTDSQIVLFSPWIKNMEQLVETFSKVSNLLGEAMPNIVFKPHPACDQDYSSLINEYKSHEKLHFDTLIPTPVLIQHASAVATINSTVGIESLLLNKKVIVMGQAFYSILGLTMHAENQTALSDRLLSVDKWNIDTHLLESFFNHLACEYQLSGRWQDATEQHISNCASKIIALAEEL
jgi:capsular polysaccharide export protein